MAVLTCEHCSSEIGCPNCGVVVEGSSNSQDVGDFHAKFNLPNTNSDISSPHSVPFELSDFRVRFLQEELDEIKEGYATGNLEKVFDGLIDLVYVALGTAHVHHFPWQAGWNEVQRANMMKERARRAEQSARGSTFDVIKPPGWKPPDIAKILRDHGYQHPDEKTTCDYTHPGGSPCVALRAAGSRYCVAHPVRQKPAHPDS